MSEDTATHPCRTGLEQTGFIIVTTGNEIADLAIDHYLGIVRGITVRSPSFGKSFIGAFKSLGGGHIREYADVCENARHEA